MRMVMTEARFREGKADFLDGCCSTTKFGTAPGARVHRLSCRGASSLVLMLVVMVMYVFLVETMRTKGCIECIMNNNDNHRIVF